MASFSLDDQHDTPVLNVIVPTISFRSAKTSTVISLPKENDIDLERVSKTLCTLLKC